MSITSEQVKQCLAMLALLLLGSLAFVHLLAVPVFEDEGSQLRWIWRIIEAGDWTLPLADGKPLEAWPMVPLLQVGLPPLFTVRAVHVIVGLIGTLLLFQLAQQILPRTSAFVAAALFAICPFTVYLQRFALSDIVMCSAGIWVLLAMLRFLQSPSSGRAAALAAALLLAALSKLPVGFVFLMAAPSALLLMPASQRARILQRTVSEKLLAAQLPALGLALLIAIVALLRLHWGKPPGFGLSDFAGVALGGYHDIGAAMGVARIGLLDELVAQLSWPVTAMASIGLLCSLLLNDWRQRWLIAMGIVPLLAIGLLAHFWYSRYLLFTLPPLIISAVGGWRSLARHAGVAGRAFELILLLVAVIFMGHQSVLLILKPMAANWSPADRFQYFDSWSSGYGYPQAAAFMSSAEYVPGTVFSLDGHSAYQLRCYLAPKWWPRVHSIDYAADGTKLRTPQQRLRNLLDSAPAWIIISDQLLLGYLDSTFGPLDPKPFALHRVASFDKPGSRVQLSLYEVTTR